MRAPGLVLWLSLFALPDAVGADVVVFPAPTAPARTLVIYSSLDSPLARPLIEGAVTEEIGWELSPGQLISGIGCVIEEAA